MRKSFWIIVFLAIYLPFEEFTLKWVPNNLYTPLRFLGEFLLLILVTTLLIDRIFLKKRWIKTPIDFPLIILLVIIFISALLNRVPPAIAILGVKNLLRYIAVFYIVIMLKPSEVEIKKLLRILFVFVLLHSIIAISQAIIGKPAFEFFTAQDVVVDGRIIRVGGVAKLAQGSYRTMVFGTMGRYNVLGNYIAMWLGFVGAVLLTKTKIITIRLWHILLMILALLLSYSRMSWIALGIGIFLIFLFSRSYKFFAYLMISCFVLFTIFAWFIVGEGVDTLAVDAGAATPLMRYLDLFSSEYIEIFMNSGRGYSYFSILPAILRVKPLLGFGPGMVASDVTNLIPTPLILAQLDLENPYAIRFLGDAGFATLIAQLGVLGALAICMIFFQLFRVGIKFWKHTNAEWKPFAVGYVVVVVMMVIFNVGSFALIYRVPSYYFWMFSAFILLQSFREKLQS